MTQGRETAAAAQMGTAKAAVFIANKNGVRIGDKVYNKGETVPFLPGRNYDSAVRQGTLVRIEGTAPQVSQMAQVLASGAAELERASGQFLEGAGQLAGGVSRLTDRTDIPAPSTELMHVAPVIKGAGAYWVGNDGMFSRVTVEDVQPIDPEAAEGLGLTPGQLAPKVIFEDETEAEFVDPLALLPEQPTGRLIAELTAEKEAEEAEEAEEQKSAAPFSGIPLEPDSSVYVLEDDAASTAFFQGVRFATAEDAEHTGINEGEPVAVLEFYASTEDFAAGKKSEGIAPLSDIVPGEIFTRIAEAVRAEDAAEPDADADTEGGEEGGTAAERLEDEAFVSQLIAERHALTLIVKAMRRGAEAGTELPEKMPLRKTVINNGLHNAEAFTIVAEGGPEALTLLDRVTDEQAHKLFEYAVEQEWVDPLPETDGQPAEGETETPEPEAGADAAAEGGKAGE